MQSTIQSCNTNFSLNYSYSVNLVDSTSQNIVITLEEIANYYGDGVIFFIKKIDSSSNTITLNAHSGETIDNNASYVMTSSAITLVCNATKWYIL